MRSPDPADDSHTTFNSNFLRSTPLIVARTVCAGHHLLARAATGCPKCRISCACLLLPSLVAAGEGKP
jgi:hypothetical protein